MQNYSIDLEKYTVCAYNEPVSRLVLGLTVTGQTCEELFWQIVQKKDLLHIHNSVADRLAVGTDLEALLFLRLEQITVIFYVLHEVCGFAL